MGWERKGGVELELEMILILGTGVRTRAGEPSVYSSLQQFTDDDGRCGAAALLLHVCDMLFVLF